MAEVKERPNINEVIKLEGFMADQFRVTEGDAPIVPVGEKFELNSPDNISRVLETYQNEPKDFFYFKASTVKGNFFLASDGEKTEFFKKEAEAKKFSDLDNKVDEFYRMKEQREAAEAEQQPSKQGDISALRQELAEAKAVIEKGAKENESLRKDLQTAIKALNDKSKGDK